MPFGLVINSEKANALQVSVENELVTRGFSAEPGMSQNLVERGVSTNSAMCRFGYGGVYYYHVDQQQDLR